MEKFYWWAFGLILGAALSTWVNIMVGNIFLTAMKELAEEQKRKQRN